MKPVTIPQDYNIEAFSGIIPECLAAVLVDETINSSEKFIVSVFESSETIEKLLPQIQLYLQLSEAGETIRILPFPAKLNEESADSGIPERIQEEIECDRLSTLTQLTDSKKNQTVLILTTSEALFQELPAPNTIKKNGITLTTNLEFDFNKLLKKLGEKFDYDCEAVCERPGQYSVRGGLVDIYPLNSNEPFRLDFFGDEIECIKSFDPTTQRTQESVNEIRIGGRTSTNDQATRCYLQNYLTLKTKWVWVEPNKIRETNPSLFERFEKLEDKNQPYFKLLNDRAKDKWLIFQELEEKPLILGNEPKWKKVSAESLEPYRRQPLESEFGMERLEAERFAREQFYEWVLDTNHINRKILAFVTNKGIQTETIKLFEEKGITPNITFIHGDIPSGFRLTRKGKKFLQWFSSEGKELLILSERELLGRNITKQAPYRRRKFPHITAIDHLLNFSELADGDYLVHLAHGICQYRGLSSMEIKGNSEEVISVEFADSVTIHIPLYDSHLLSRYVGLNKSHPKLSRLGSGNWEKTRQAAEKATFDFASELLSLQATRDKDEGIRFEKDNEWQITFENAFPFKETKDQFQAIIETKADMEKPRPMDRLICGDVGFGKTEVAIRAAFKAVQNNCQVALLVPTTILAQQHFDSFCKRFFHYPVQVEMLSRFRNKKEQKKILEYTADGKIDILIGTHRLLSGDVKFKNLGLLVVDEEHRFGVKHKEKLKQFRKEVDVLTMSATPIPRTLYLALMGARDLSVIETPPADRLPIETIVKNYDPNLVKKSIHRELARGGQVFYLHNRVQTIQAVARQLAEWIPDAKIAVGHGQMTETALEKVMTEFVAGKHDILVCTTIIENGLDIPNCNTIIIEGADRFGLSQLYQLRGRVGRFNRQAYAYLLLHRHAHLVDLARKRLGAMRQHNQLGAGFKIAMRDLELRGAGNLLGIQQSGHIAGVGFDLYCQLLRQSVNRLKGDSGAIRIRATVKLDFITNASDDEKYRSTGFGFDALKEDEVASTRIEPVEAIIPNQYLPEARLRIEYYRKLALASELEEINELENELRDRFGKLPKPLKFLIQTSYIRVRAELAGIKSVETEGNRLKCRLATSRGTEYLRTNGRFPRLTTNKAHLRLREIEQFLARQRPIQ